MNVSHKFDIALLSFRQQLRELNVVGVVEIEAGLVCEEVSLVVVTGFDSEMREAPQIFNIGQGVPFCLLDLERMRSSSPQGVVEYRP